MQEESIPEENFYMIKFNEKNKQKAGLEKNIYIPPHKLRLFEQSLRKDLIESQIALEIQQRTNWETLKCNITSLVNKVNTANIEFVVLELFTENLVRAKGLLVNSIIRAQSSSPGLTPVCASLVGVINTKIPEIGSLLIRRVILQFRRAFKRSDRLVCFSSVKFLAHLINQKLLTEFFGLEMLIFLLEINTSDAVELAISFMIEAGQVLFELSEVGVNLVFERFKTLLHEGEVVKKVQFAIEKLFAVRKNNFKENPGLIKELDLVDENDQITHIINFDDETITAENELNNFKFDPLYDEHEMDWQEIKVEILGEETITNLQTQKDNKIKKESEMTEETEKDNAEKQPNEAVITDMTQESLVQLRQSIYLRIMNSIDFEECAHKLLLMKLPVTQWEEMGNMIIDCCAEERVYINYYGLLGERLCKTKEDFIKVFHKTFVDRFLVIDEYKTQKIRKIAKFFAHLLSFDAIDWFVLKCIDLREESTTASSRIFLKVLFQDLALNLGIKGLNDRLQDVDMSENFEGLFPKNSLENMEFAINFFISIGLKALTEDYQEFFREQLALEDDSDKNIEKEPLIVNKQDQIEKDSVIPHEKHQPKNSKNQKNSEKKEHNSGSSFSSEFSNEMKNKRKKVKKY